MEKMSTFADLEAMIDCWTTEIEECQGVFKNQADDVTKNFFHIVENREKVCPKLHTLLLQPSAKISGNSRRSKIVRFKPHERAIG